MTYMSEREGVLLRMPRVFECVLNTPVKKWLDSSYKHIKNLGIEIYLLVVLHCMILLIIILTNAESLVKDQLCYYEEVCNVHYQQHRQRAWICIIGKHVHVYDILHDLCDYKLVIIAGVVGE